MAVLALASSFFIPKRLEQLADSPSLPPVNHHANELNAMRAMSYDLERKHHEDKRRYVALPARSHAEPILTILAAVPLSQPAGGEFAASR